MVDHIPVDAQADEFFGRRFLRTARAAICRHDPGNHVRRRPHAMEILARLFWCVLVAGNAGVDVGVFRVSRKLQFRFHNADTPCDSPYGS